MNILVTGGAGYIGSHLCKILKEKGFTPIVFDNLSRGFEESVKWGPLFIGDLRNQEKIIEVFEKVKIGAVMHLGALSYVGESMENPHLYFENNVYGTLNLLETMKENNVKKIIFSSTCAVYGSPADIPVSEDTAISPESPYGTSKLLAESLINEYKNLGHIDPIIFRYFNVIGSDPDLEIGECHEPETHIVPLAIHAALTGEPLHLYGNDYSTKDGTCIRDYLHVNDIATAHCLALEYNSSSSKHIFNLGNDKPFSVLEIVKLVEEVTKKKINLSLKERRFGDAEALYSSSNDARNYLNWSPHFKNLKESINHALNWKIKQDVDG